ncbi:MAG: T9SS type A sorting domain-containing protein [Chitinophagales bacterium]|nr:T9SS type A sorting domain-containing protein [Chitinophagales bacterium]
MVRVFAIAFSILFSVSLSAGQSAMQLKLLIVNNSGTLSDETTLYIGQGTTPAFNLFEDIAKGFNPSTIVPQIYSLTSDSVACSINQYGDFTSSVAISLGVRTDTSGFFSIYPSLIDNFDQASILLLEDRMTGTFHDLRGNHYNFYSSQGGFVIGRFVLHISYPPVITTIEADCENWDGKIKVMQEPVITWTSCRAFDGNGLLMGSYFNINGNFTFHFLPEDTYNVVFTYNDYIVTKQIFVKGNKVEVDISASTYNAIVGQMVQFFSLTKNATNYVWDFGDNTLITGISNPEMSFYEAGIYPVVLKCTNAKGCEASDTLMMNITEGTSIKNNSLNNVRVFSSRQDIVIENLQPNAPYIWSVTNILGSVVAQGTTSSINERITLPDAPSGVYVVTLQANGQRLSKKVLLKN